MTVTINLYVLDRGFVLVGAPEPDPDANPLWVRLRRCAVVRRWGTTAGLGQLAREGPQPETVLDDEPPGTAVNVDYALRIIPCDETAWGSWLSEPEEKGRGKTSKSVPEKNR